MAALALWPCVSSAQYTNISEDFSSAPAARGWSTFGEGSLFQWNADTRKLDVTWDSTKSNSYFYLPLNTTLTTNTDFVLEFDIELRDFAGGSTPGKASNFPIGMGLSRWAAATNASYVRAFGTCSDLVEFSFWADPGGEWLWGASVSSVMIDSGGFGWAYGDSNWGLESNAVYRVRMDFDAARGVLSTTVTTNGVSCGPVDDARIAAGHQGFRVDQLAVYSYSEEGQDPMYAGSVKAHGSIDNVRLRVAPRVTISRTGAIQLRTLAGYVYALERSVDGATWHTAGEPVNGTGDAVTLTDTNAPGGAVLYRVNAAQL